MMTFSSKKLPIELDSDHDAAALIRKLGIALFGVSICLGLASILSGVGLRPAVIVAVGVGLVMMLLVRAQKFAAAANVLCWGLLLVGCVAVYRFGLRSVGALVIPMAIMSAGWLLGRRSAFYIALVSSTMSLVVYLQHIQGNERTPPPIDSNDALVHIGIFMVTAILAAAMAATLQRQLNKVNALARSLQEANATLEDRVAERSAQLASVQQQVMDTEKLTSLGAMVAGISHELNTPLGNALMVATSLEAQVGNLAQKAEAGQLTRSALSAFIAGATEMATLTSQSITRAAELVASFKQIAVDQTSEQRRPFQLDQVVSDNVAAMRPSIRNAGIVIEINVPADIECDSYPGPLGQVVTNLVQNAVLHGFEGRAQGRVVINGSVRGDRVCLEVSDDGQGMEPQVLSRVFEPFFTTRMGKGGSGLGLSVSHRIASSVLGGDLTVRSQPGQGTTFTLSFLKLLPSAIPNDQ